MSLGKLIGKGNTAEVYQWGETEVIKLFDNRIPENLIEREYQCSLQIQQLFLPSPSVKGITEIDGKKGLIYEKAEGDSLTNLLSKHPLSIKKKAQLFSQLHFQIHQAEAANLPKQKENFLRNIQMTELLTNQEKQSICDFLAALPEGNQVCHMDFHPDNVLVSGEKVKVIDWMTAASGNPLGDLARTYIIFKHAYLPPSMSFMVRFLLGFLRNKFCQYYLDDYVKRRNFSMDEIEKWSLPVMASRLVEGIHPDEKKVLIVQIRKLSQKYL